MQDPAFSRDGIEIDATKILCGISEAQGYCPTNTQEI